MRCVKHMSPRVLRLRGVSREDEAEEKRGRMAKRYFHLLILHKQCVYTQAKTHQLISKNVLFFFFINMALNGGG